MKIYKLCGTFVLLIVCAFFVRIQATDSLCGDWLQYKDEWCYKIYDDKLYTFAEAKNLCSEISEYDHTSLAIIRSKEEQEFLTNYLFKTEKKVENVWIGANYDNDTFHWVDNSALGYTNWLKATKNKTATCVQMQAEEDWIGKWLDVPCTIKSLVVCQKIHWTRARLEKVYYDAQHQQQVWNAEANKVNQTQSGIISEAKKIIEQANQTIAQQEEKIRQADRKLYDLHNAIYQKKTEFHYMDNKIIKLAIELKITMLEGCGFGDLVGANFSEITCSDDTACTVYIDQLYSFKMKFVANQDSQTIQVQTAFGNYYTNSINENGCKYVKCPLVKGQEYYFIVDKYQTSLLYHAQEDFQVRLTGDQGILACSYFNLNVLDHDSNITTTLPTKTTPAH